MPSVSRRHLLLALAASVAIHLLMMAWVRLPAMQATPAGSRDAIEVLLLAPPKPTVLARPASGASRPSPRPVPNPATNSARKAVVADIRPAAERMPITLAPDSRLQASQAVSRPPGEVPKEPTTESHASPEADTVPRASTSSHGLLAASLEHARGVVQDQIRDQIREEAMERRGPPGSSPPPVLARPVLPAIDAALYRPAPGEQRRADGLLKVVSASGRVYCLQAPSPSMGGGLVPVLSVPTNCP